jgi:two-component system sensor histidine kinase TctE
MKKTSVRQVLLVWLLSPLLLLYSLGGFADYLIVLPKTSASADRSLLDIALALAQTAQSPSNPQDPRPVRTEEEPVSVHFLITDADNRFIAGDREFPRPPSARADNPLFYENELKGKRFRAVALRLAGSKTGWRILVGKELLSPAQKLSEVFIKIIIPEIFFALIAVYFVFLGIRRGLAPLEELRREIASRSYEDLSPIREEQAPVEMQPMVHAINDLLGKLKTSLKAQKQFIAFAAHQIRTPLAGLKMQVELASQNRNPEEWPNILNQLKTAADRTTHLANQILTLARTESDFNLKDKMQPADLKAVAQSVANEWVPRALVKNIDLGFSLEPVWVQGELRLLRELLVNLIDNAVHYTPSGGHITIRTHIEQGAGLLEVEDNGPGIPEAQRQQVFIRFYRLDENTANNGCGLGLAIVKEIADLHNAEVEIKTPAHGQGTLVCVRFPPKKGH